MRFSIASCGVFNNFGLISDDVIFGLKKCTLRSIRFVSKSGISHQYSRLLAQISWPPVYCCYVPSSRRGHKHMHVLMYSTKGRMCKKVYHITGNSAAGAGHHLHYFKLLPILLRVSMRTTRSRNESAFITGRARDQRQSRGRRTILFFFGVLTNSTATIGGLWQSALLSGCRVPTLNHATVVSSIQKGDKLRHSGPDQELCHKTEHAKNRRVKGAHFVAQSSATDVTLPELTFSVDIKEKGFRYALFTVFPTLFFKRKKHGSTCGYMVLHIWYDTYCFVPNAIGFGESVSFFGF